MAEQLDFFGGADSTDPPAVPPVIHRDGPIVERIVALAKPPCGHCVMVADLIRRPGGRELPEAWKGFNRIDVLRAVYRVTQPDGSVLELCAQHEQEHTERGDGDG